ncbi:hypothetical protein JCM5296_006609 [Sporobolomyces johnsonii]
MTSSHWRSPAFNSSAGSPTASRHHAHHARRPHQQPHHPGQQHGDPEFDSSPAYLADDFSAPVESAAGCLADESREGSGKSSDWDERDRHDVAADDPTKADADLLPPPEVVERPGTTRRTSSQKLRAASDALAAANIISLGGDTDWDSRPPGIDPNLVDIPELKAKCIIQAADCSASHVEFSVLTNDTLPGFLASARPSFAKVRWLHVNGLSWDVIKPLALHYDLHPLSLEDMLHHGSSSATKSKADYYRQHLFVRLLQHRTLQHPGFDPDFPEEILGGSRTTGKAKPHHMREQFGFHHHHRDEEAIIDSTSTASLAGSPSTTPTNRSETATPVAVSPKSHSQYVRNLRDAFQGVQRPKDEDLRMLTHNRSGLSNRLHATTAKGPRGAQFAKRQRKKAEEGTAARWTVAALTKDVKVHIHVEQLSIFLLRDGTILSFSQDAGYHPQISQIFERLQSKDDLIRDAEDASFVLQALLDVTADDALDIVDEFRDQLTTLESRVLARPDMDDVRHLHILSSQLLLLKSTITPFQLLLQAIRSQDDAKAAAASKLSGSEAGGGDGAGEGPTKAFVPAVRRGFVSHDAKVYLGDVMDHVDSVLSSLDLFSDLSENLLSYVFNSMSYASNSYMQALSVVSVVFMPATFLSSYFGMNFSTGYFVDELDIGVHRFWEIIIPITVITVLLFAWTYLVEITKSLRRNALRLHHKMLSLSSLPYVPTSMVATLPPRTRALSRPAPPTRIQSTRAQNISLSEETLPESEDWEPPSDEPELTLPQIRESIGKWEDELKSKGRDVSGRTIVVVHSLPYVCTLHPTKSHSVTLDRHILPDTTEESLLGSGATTPLEIQPGDPLLRPRALHSPTTQPHHSLKHKMPPSSFPHPANSLRPSFHPELPESRAPSPDGNGTGASNSGAATPQQQTHRWVLHPRRGHAALNSGLRSLANRPLLVVGRPDDLVNADGEALSSNQLGATEKKDLERGLRSMAGPEDGIGCVPVWVEDQLHTKFYEGMCKTYLWPIFHYLALPDNISKSSETAAWNAYYETNMVYAKKVASVYKPGDLIWIHDYHLLLVPQMLRELLPGQSPNISLFLHCPFPSSEFFRCLPRREAILDGMLGCNLVCFQTHSYARHFLSSCVRVMGYEARLGGVDAHGNITRIAHCPIGIDVDNVEADRASAGVKPKIEALRRLYAGKKIIVGRDKLDPTKGVLPKLRAFERFLHDYPEWANKVVLMQVTSPSPGDSPALATKVSELVDQINGTYGSLEFQPVHHYHQTIERDEYFALLTVADLALITSRRDGMNTTSMEYIICQAEAKGSLIVSEFTGVSALLNKAIKVNPWDLGGVARAIDSCLKAPLEERTLRHNALHRAITAQTASVWAHTNILKLLESLQGEQASQNTPPLDTDALISKYKSASKRLLLFDYDGTLTPIVKDPAAAVPSPSLLESLATLTADPKNVVYIISGRDGAFLEEQLGHIENLGMSAEHGCFIRAPGSKEWISLTDDFNMDWKKDVLRIFRYYEARTQGAFVEKKISSVTFHYRNADPVFGLFQAKECQAMLESMQESLPIDVLVGKKNVEVRPAHTNKGEIVRRLLYQYPQAEFCMCAGDDKTDEDMFHSMARVFSNYTPGGPRMMISPPESFALFPSLAKAAAAEGVATTSEPIESKLDPSASFMIAIEAKETQGAKMTMANAVLEDPAAMISLLEKLAAISKA